MYNYYANQAQYGSACRPVIFSKAEVKKIKGKDSLVICSTQPFFDELRCYCEYCHPFYAKFEFCLDWNLDLPVFISDDEMETVLPLETKINGYTIYSDMIQPFCGTCCSTVPMSCIYDKDNDHITIAKYFPRHKKCNCDEEDSIRLTIDEVAPVAQPIVQASAKVK